MQQPDTDLLLAVRRCHERIWTRLVHPELGLIYDFVGADDDPRPRYWWLPAAAEIERRYPNPQGWSTGMEDSSINGGVYLAAMVSAHAVTGDHEYADKARVLFGGLLRTARCSSEAGFIARSVTPDGRRWYPASSVDQYTWWLHGAWAYARSGLASGPELEAVRSVAQDVCTRLERDGWEILRDDGPQAFYGDLHAFTPDRSTRLLEVLRIAHDLTGVEHWLDVYHDKVGERNGERLASVQDMLAFTATPYAVLQTAASLVPLVQLEADTSIRSRYVSALNACGRGLWYCVPACYRYDPERVATADWNPDWRTRYPESGSPKGGMQYMPPGWALEDEVVRRPCEAIMAILYATDTDPALRHEPVRAELRAALQHALTVYEYEHLHSYALVYAEAVYWLARARQILP